jgi:putative hydrolase of the HAD superfamily
MASNYDRRLRSVAAGLPALRPIAHLVISSEVGWRKPAGLFFKALCLEIGDEPGHILHVGDDRTNDYEPARLAGLHALLFDSKAQEHSSAVLRIGRLKELLDLLPGAKPGAAGIKG